MMIGPLNTISADFTDTIVPVLMLCDTDIGPVICTVKFSKCACR